MIAQSTVFRYKGRGIDPQAVGRELNVRAVLTGRMMQSGGSLRIGTELVDVATGSQLWGAQYDRKPGDIFAIQDEISSEISGNLRLKLTRAEKKRLTKRQTRRCRGLPALPERPSSLEQVDRRRILQGHRILSASCRERSQLRSRLCWLGRFVCASWDGTVICRRRTRSLKPKSPRWQPCGSTRISEKPTRPSRPCCGFTIGNGKRPRRNSNAASRSIPPTQLPIIGTPSM